MIYQRFTLFFLLTCGLILSQCTPTENKNPDKQVKENSTEDNFGPYVIDSAFNSAISTYAFDSVSWVAVDPVTEYLYVLQRSYPPVSVWTPEGELVSQWTTRELGYPHSLSVIYNKGEGHVWITDFAPPQSAGDGWGHCIKKFSLSGEMIGTIGECGSHTEGTGLAPLQFDKVTDVAMDSDGNLFISDGDLGGLNNRVLKVGNDQEVLMDWSAPGNKAGLGPKEFNLPHAVEVDILDRVWIVDALNSRVQVITNEGEYLGEWRFDSTLAPNGIGIGAIEEYEGKPMANVVICFRPTDMTSSLEAKVIVNKALMDPENPRQIGSLHPLAEWTQPNQQGSSMLHSCTESKTNSAIYLAFLNHNSSPMKYILK